MDPIDHHNLSQYLLAGTYPVEIESRYTRANFRRKASHFRVEGEKLYKVSEYQIIN